MATEYPTRCGSIVESNGEVMLMTVRCRLLLENDHTKVFYKFFTMRRVEFADFPDEPSIILIDLIDQNIRIMMKAGFVF